MFTLNAKLLVFLGEIVAVISSDLFEILSIMLEEA